jgi:hypothetical protein
LCAFHDPALRRSRNTDKDTKIVYDSHSVDGKRQDVILRSPPGKMSVYSEKGKDKKKEKMTEKAAEKEFRNNALYDKE